MEVRIIAEGPADKDVIKALVRKLTGVESENIITILPSDTVDETDRFSGNFSSWQLVLENMADNSFWENATATIAEEDYFFAIHIDTAERGEPGYDVNQPLRTGVADWKQYAAELRKEVAQKMKALIPAQYHDHIAYAIAIEETDAWILPLFENVKQDTASHAQPKERLRDLIGVDKKLQKQFVNTGKKDLDYAKLGKVVTHDLKLCRKKCYSLDAFCNEVESINLQLASN